MCYVASDVLNTSVDVGFISANGTKLLRISGRTPIGVLLLLHIVTRPAGGHIHSSIVQVPSPLRPSVILYSSSSCLLYSTVCPLSVVVHAEIRKQGNNALMNRTTGHVELCSQISVDDSEVSKLQITVKGKKCIESWRQFGLYQQHSICRTSRFDNGFCLISPGSGRSQ